MERLAPLSMGKEMDGRLTPPSRGSYLSLCLLIFSPETPSDHFRPGVKKAMDYQAKEPQPANSDTMSRPFTGEDVFVDDARTFKHPQSPKKTPARQLTATTSSRKSKSCVQYLDGTKDSRDDAKFETAMDILKEVGIQTPSIVEIIGPAESFDILFKCGDKFGCYEGKTSNFWLLGYGLSEKDMWRCYGDGGRNVPFLRDWVYDE